MEDSIDRYYTPVYSAIARLTRLPDRGDLETLTQDVLADLREHQDAFDAEARKGIFMYKTILFHVFSFLKEQGDDRRLLFLKKTLPIDPEFLSRIGEE